ncbi:hypothetical protein LEMLEM_LOCUS27140 [Lemmus lemmus]
MHFGGRLRALESEAGGRASQEARAAEGPEPNSGSRSRFAFHTGCSHCATRGAALESKGKALSITEQAADSSGAPSRLCFPHKQAQKFPRETQGPRCTCFLAHGPLPSEKLLQREERGKEEARERERERDEKTTDLAREHDGPIQHTAGSYVSGKERVLQGTTLS